LNLIIQNTELEFGPNDLNQTTTYILNTEMHEILTAKEYGPFRAPHLAQFLELTYKNFLSDIFTK